MNGQRSGGQVRGHGLNRRGFIAGATAMAAVGAGRAADEKAVKVKYRVGVIGHTGRGNYGHGLDRVWLDVLGCKIVAVADGNKAALPAAVKRLGGAKGYTDYRRMLDEAKPDLVSVCPRWLDQKRDMVVAAAERGVRGIYMEKPMCPTLADADDMVAACKKNKVKLAISHQTRYCPRVKAVRELIASGKLGRVLELRGRGKEDRRGGGEDLWILGTHVLNLMHHFGGDPKWCFATVLQGGRPVGPGDVKPGAEGIGPLAGDEVHAMYRLGDGVTGHFDSIRNASGQPSRFCLWIYGSKGVVVLGHGYLCNVYYLPDSSWSPGQSGKKWVPVSSAGVGKGEPIKHGAMHDGNVTAVQDLIAAIEQGREPQCNLHEARTATEMIVSVFESHRLGGPVNFPLKNRKNPLTMLK